MLPRPKFDRLIDLFVAALIGFTLAPLGCMSAVHAQPGGPAVVIVQKVTEEKIAPYQEFVGSVKANRRSVIGSAVDGRVEQFMVEAGDPVAAGDELAQLRTRTISLEIAAAKAELKLREAELQELKNGLRDEEIQLERAKSRAANAANAYAQAKLKRFEALFKSSSGVSRDEYESSRAEALAAQAIVEQTAASLALAEQGTRQERIEQAAARVTVQQEIVANLEDRKKKYTVKSPFNGFVVAELTETGAWVRQGDAVAEVVEIDPVEIEVFVPEALVRFTQDGDAVTIRIDALPDEQFQGTVTRIVPLADDRSRSFPVRVSVPNPAINGRHRLLPGMLAHIALPISEPKNELMVHKDALQINGDKSIVFKIVDNSAVPVPVRYGMAEGFKIAVHPLLPGQLASGDAVVVIGNERLRPGQQVVATEQKEDREPTKPAQ
ncbi:efflux RND transporter periplasmic adaptor subunit [Crateriforma conspicua]|uniref:Cation efflux system protein CusB n=1 Tax=Crateriforma conspicua TaxID=2527996 RepID=A0A5C5YA06_9PLAN|nr:efflux RND transporter periplasmic adaptor subunit [Crateriforma conspicua]TWT71291.1 Cation efflux system protein CusB precursor [Crateriforma conspicua]